MNWISPGNYCHSREPSRREEFRTGRIWTPRFLEEAQWVDGKVHFALDPSALNQTLLDA